MIIKILQKGMDEPMLLLFIVMCSVGAWAYERNNLYIDTYESVKFIYSGAIGNEKGILYYFCHICVIFFYFLRH